MKKTLAMILALAMVSALCGILFVSAEDTNLVAGKQYTISEQFRAGGADVGWGWDENAPISYPDDNYELTDGVLPNAEDGYQAAEWMGFNHNTPVQTERGYAFVKFDLGETADLSSAKFVSYKDKTSGIACPYKVEVLISDDAENYTSAGIVEYATEDLDAMTDLALQIVSIELEGSARYVEFRFTSYGWCFLGELEIYGSVAEQAPESSEEAPESSEEAPESSEEAPSEPEVDLKAEYTDSIATLVGEATEDTSFDIVLDSTADAEGVVTVTMTIDNIADGASLTGLYAYLYYDAERMTLTTTANSEGALECLTKLPCDEWAEDNVICAKDGYIDIGIGVTKDPMTAISADAPIVLTFTFQMNEGFEYAGVYATTADASASDKDFNDYYGNGAYEIAELPAEVVDPSEDVSSDETPVPGTGDAGIVVFAVLAIVAICGAAVVVKVRG